MTEVRDVHNSKSVLYDNFYILHSTFQLLILNLNELTSYSIVLTLYFSYLLSQSVFSVALLDVANQRLCYRDCIPEDSGEAWLEIRPSFTIFQARTNVKGDFKRLDKHC